MSLNEGKCAIQRRKLIVKMKDNNKTRDEELKKIKKTNFTIDNHSKNRAIKEIR